MPSSNSGPSNDRSGPNSERSGTNSGESNEDATPVTVAFVCVQNAGRSQMATAFAEREVERRELEGEVAVLTGGTQPADHVHEEVVEVMSELDFALGDRGPREISFEKIQDSDYVITMGCSADDVCPAGWAGENRDWGLDDPDGGELDDVRAIRDEIERRVSDLLDEIEHSS